MPDVSHVSPNLRSLVHLTPQSGCVRQPRSTQGGRSLSFESVLRSRPLTGNSPSMVLNAEGNQSKPTQTEPKTSLVFKYPCGAMLTIEPRCRQASPPVSRRPEDVSHLFLQLWNLEECPSYLTSVPNNQEHSIVCKLAVRVCCQKLTDVPHNGAFTKLNAFFSPNKYYNYYIGKLPTYERESK